MNNNQNEEDKLKAMLEAASDDSDNSLKVNNADKGSPKKAILITSGVVAALGIVIAVGAFSLRPQEFEDQTESPTWVSQQVEKEEVAAINDRWDFEYPVEVPEWTKQPFSVETILNDEEMLAEVTEFADSMQGFYAQVAWMPSGIEQDYENAPEPYTNDLSQQYVEGDVINPRFSYTLQEDYKEAYSTYIQRLINPTFGGWIFAQRSFPAKPLKSDTTYEVLSDMFSDEWWNNNIVQGEDYSALPILVDWNGDNYGGLELAETEDGRFGTFFGVVNEDEGEMVTVESLGPDERNSEKLKVNTPVKYVAFGIDDKLIEKKGVLSLTLVSNSEPAAQNRVVISEVEFNLN